MRMISLLSVIAFASAATAMEARAETKTYDCEGFGMVTIDFANKTVRYKGEYGGPVKTGLNEMYKLDKPTPSGATLDTKAMDEQR